MGSREKDNSAPHQPLLSSLVVRPSDNGGGGAAGATASVAVGIDYEAGEVRRDAQPPYSRSDRFSGDHGHRPRGGSASPGRRRPDSRSSPGFDHSGAPPRSRGYGSARVNVRSRDYSPPHGRARDGGRFSGRGFDDLGHGAGPLRGEVVPRNNPNVRPREGDWFCSDPVCNNLNFARREICNNCKRPRDAPPLRSPPRRGFPAPPPLPPRRFPGPLDRSPGPLDRSPGRMMNGYRSPPRGWGRDDPRDFRAGGPPYPRHEGRFFDPLLRRDYAEEDRDRGRFERPLPLEWNHRDRARDNIFNDRRRAPSPPMGAPPPRGHWGRDVRERSRSPIRGGPPLKDYRRDMFMERGRDVRRGMGRAAY